MEQVERERDGAGTAHAAQEPIAIIGMGCRFPGADGQPITTPEAFWELLCSGVDIARPVPAKRWDVAAYYDATPGTPGKVYVRDGYWLTDLDGFDAGFFQLAAREAAAMDPQQRLLLEVSWEALEAAAIPPGDLAGSQTGIFVSSFWDDYSAQRIYTGSGAQIDRYATLSNVRALTAGRLAHMLGAHGPNLHIDTACSAALTAAHLACQALRAGECDLALAGGVYLLEGPEIMLGLCQMGALAPDGRSKAFDQRADGFGLGEGCVVVVLKRLAAAVADGDPLWAVIRGSAINHDGRSRTVTTPNGVAQRALLRQTLRVAGVGPHAIHYVEAHGTGTELGDPIEVLALGEVLGAGRTAAGVEPLLLGSVKSNIGHLNAAAGLAGLCKAVLALQHAAVPPTLHIAQLNRRIPWAKLEVAVPTTMTPWPSPAEPRMAGVSSFGMSGSNAHVILEAAPQVATVAGAADHPAHLLPLAAKDATALTEYVGRYVAYLDAHPDVDLGDLCYTAQVGRSTFAHRLCVAAGSASELRARLAEVADGSLAPGVARGLVGSTKPKVAFLFTGQGSQYAGMGLELDATEPTFRAALDACATVLDPLFGRPLRAILNDSAVIDQTTFTQPALFALEYALATLWQAWGIEPVILIGHSVGELVAACLAGVFSLEDGLKLVAARGRLMGALPPDGAMVAIAAEEVRVRDAIAPYTEAVSIAAINGPTSVVISGRTDAVHAIAAQFPAECVRTQALTVSHAFHSPLLDPMLADFRAVAEGVTYHAPTRRLVSNLTGDLAGDAVATPDYWVRHVREAVRFADGVQTLHAQGVNIFLEIGPKPVLLGLVQQGVGDGGSGIGDRGSGSGDRGSGIGDRGSGIGDRHTAHDTQLSAIGYRLSAIGYVPSLRPNQPPYQTMLNGLGALYVRGVAVHWAGLHRNLARRKIVLPTYPFQRQRYWVEAPTHRAAIRPLVDQVIHLPQRGETICETTFSVAALPFLAEHQIYGAVVAPGACQLVLALSAAELSLGTPGLTLHDVILPQALLLPEGQARTVQTIISRAPDQAAAMRVFQITSFPADATGDGVAVATHALGKVALVAAPGHPGGDLVALRQRCTTPLDLTGWGMAGVTLGPTFRWIAEAWQSSDPATPELLARLVQPSAVATQAGYPLHPGLLDACFQVVGLQGTAQHETLLPFALTALHWQMPAKGDVWWCHILPTGPLTWDVQLLDPTGALVVALTGFQMRAASASAIQGRPAWHDWLYTVVWQPQPTVGLVPDNLPVPARVLPWLIFADHQGVGAALAAQLRASGDTVWEIYAAAPGALVPTTDAWQQVIDSEAATAYQRVVGIHPRWQGVVHLWSLDMPPVQEDVCAAGVDLVAATRRGCGSALLLVQALLTGQHTSGGLWLVTQDAQAVVAEDSVGGVAQAGLWGMGKVIGLEYPELRPVCVDLSSAGAEPDQIRHLMALLTTAGAPEAGAAQIALRPTGQYSARLQRATAQANTAPLIRPDATYLITGGLGGLGLAVADWLVASGARHLLLVGRRGPDVAAQSRLDAMTAHGVTVQVAPADVADAAQLRTALAHVAEHAPLAGVIHSVGVLDDGALPNQAWGRFAKVLAPKVQGAWNLHWLMQGKALDFVVFFSSVTSLLGNRGQANYAAANAFLDAFAAYRRARGQPAVSLNWGPWAEIGVAATRAPARLMAAQTTGMGVIPPATGIAALAGLVQAAYGQVGVVPITWEQYALPAGADRVYFEALQPRRERPSAAAQAPSPPSIRRHLATVPPSQRYAVVSQWLQTEVRTLLQLQQAPAMEIGFQDLGMDSLLSIELRRQLERGLDCALPATIAFEYPSITDLAHYLLTTVVKGDVPETAPGSESAPAVPAWSDKQPPDAPSIAVEDLSDEDAEARLLERLQQLGM